MVNKTISRSRRLRGADFANARREIVAFVNNTVDEAKIAGKIYADAKDTATLALALQALNRESNNLFAALQPKDNPPQAVIPLTGDTVNATGGRRAILILNPATSLAALTINFPANPAHGYRLQVVSTRAVTAVTWGGNGNSTAGTPAGLTAFNGLEFMFIEGSSNTWVRIA